MTWVSVIVICSVLSIASLLVVAFSTPPRQEHEVNSAIQLLKSDPVRWVRVDEERYWAREKKGNCAVRYRYTPPSRVHKAACYEVIQWSPAFLEVRKMLEDPITGVRIGTSHLPGILQRKRLLAALADWNAKKRGNI